MNLFNTNIHILVIFKNDMIHSIDQGFTSSYSKLQGGFREKKTITFEPNGKIRNNLYTGIFANNKSKINTDIKIYSI